MKSKKSAFLSLGLASLCVVSISFPNVLYADSGTWTGSLGTGAAWNVTGNWSTTDPDLYPSGTDSIATFTGNFTGGISMSGNNTLGGIDFTDTASSFQGLSLQAGILNFSTTAGTPTINFNSGGALLWLGGGTGGLNVTGNQGLEIYNAAGDLNGTIRLGVSGGTSVTWSGFSGGLLLAQGNFQPQQANQLATGAGSWVTLGTSTTSAQLRLFQDSRNQAVTGLNGTSNGRVVQGSYSQNKVGTLTLLTNSIAADSFDFAGVLGSISATPATVKQENYFGISVNGAGTQTLSGANTYVGQTTVTAGTLKLASDTALGAGVTASLTTTAASNSATVDDSTGLTVGQLVTGAGVAKGTYITAVSGTTVTLSSNAAASGANSSTFAGVTTVASGGVVDLNGRTITESFGTNGSDGLSGAGLGAGGTLKNTSGTTAVINGNILSNSSYSIGSGNISVNGIVGRRSGSGSTITKTGTGTLTLGGSENNATFGTVGLVIDAANSTVVLAKNGANILAVSDVTINSGTLKMDPNNQVSAASAWSGQIANTVTMNGGTWDLNDSGTNGVNNRVKGVIGAAGTITNSGTGLAQLTFGQRDNATRIFSGTITDGVNGGTVSLVVGDTNSGTPYQQLGGNNSYSGGTTIFSGRMIMGHNNAFGTGVVSNRSQIDLNGFNLGNSLVSPGNGAIYTNTSATAATVSTGFNADQSAGVVISDFTVGSSAGDINWSGDIYRTNATGTITKNGSASVTFGGDISNMGLNLTAGTTELSGTLSGSVNATVSLGAVMNVTTGGLMNGTNTTTVAGLFALASGGTYKFDIGANMINDALVGTGTVNLDGIFAFDLTGASIASGNTWQIVDVTNLTESFGSNFNVSGFNSAGNVWTKSDGTQQWTFSEESGQLGLAIVPEPNAAILVAGLGTLALLRRRRI